MNKRVVGKLNYKVHPDEPDVINHFVEISGVVPSLKRVMGPFIYKQMRDVLFKHYKKDIIQDWDFQDGSEHQSFNSSYYRIRTKNGSDCLVHFRRTFNMLSDNYLISASQKKYVNHFAKMSVDVDVYYSFYEGAPADLLKILEVLRVEQTTAHNQINIICQDEGGLYTKAYPLKSSEYDYDLDLHYGDGFSDFHDLNVKRIDESSKGIVLLHGAPGAGKCVVDTTMITIKDKDSGEIKQISIKDFKDLL